LWCWVFVVILCVGNSWSDIPEAGGFKYGVAATCLDDITQDELASAPIKYADGLHNNWWNVPEDTRNL
jgi:hypothetical protein